MTTKLLFILVLFEVQYCYSREIPYVFKHSAHAAIIFSYSFTLTDLSLDKINFVNDKECKQFYKMDLVKLDKTSQINK